METTHTTKEAGPRRLGGLKGWLIGLSVFALTVAAFYGVENWRGKRAWETYKQQLVAEGRLLDPSLLIPPRIPAESNMFAVPEMRVFVKGSGIELSQSNGPHDRAESNRVVIARLTLGAADTAGSAIHAESVQEAAALIRDRARPRVMGAWGFYIAPKAVLDREPVEIRLRADQPVEKQELETLLEGFTVEKGGAGEFLILLPSTVGALEVLESTPSIEDEWAPIAAALKRPSARMEGDYENLYNAPIASYIAVRIFAQTLAMQAQSYLLLEQSGEALERLTLIQSFRPILEGQPLTLVGAMISVAVNGLYVSVIQQGLGLDAWSEGELRTLDEQLQSIDLLPLVSASFQTEMVTVVQLAEMMPLSKIMHLEYLGPPPGRIVDWRDLADWEFIQAKLAALVPRGWTYQNAVNYARLMDINIAPMREALPLVAPRKFEAAFEKVTSELETPSPFNYLAHIGVPNLVKALRTTAKNQTLIHQARIAIALKRYQMTHGAYPESLDQVVPQFLSEIPFDVIDGEPMRYEKISDNEYVLYSLGWNETDDGAKAEDSADWVWSLREP